MRQSSPDWHRFRKRLRREFGSVSNRRKKPNAAPLGFAGLVCFAHHVAPGYFPVGEIHHDLRLVREASGRGIGDGCRRSLLADAARRTGGGDSNGEEERARELIAAGADINALEPDEYPPLCMAVDQMEVAEVRRLLAYGANPNIADPEEKRTPLKMARRLYKEMGFGPAQERSPARGDDGAGPAGKRPANRGTQGAARGDHLPAGGRGRACSHITRSSAHVCRRPVANSLYSASVGL